MSQVITLGNELLGRSGKQGILKPMPDGKGYYRMGSGGFNIPNRMGTTYPWNDYLEECMQEGSDFNRRVVNGQMYCEWGHPEHFYYERVNGVIVRTEISDIFEWIQRMRKVEEDRICAHIRKVHFILTGSRRDPILTEVEIGPAGTGNMQALTRTGLENPDINFAVSIRSVTAPQQMGDRVKHVEHWTGFDVVPEQGMLNACKHLSVGLEAFMESTPSNDNSFQTTVEEAIHVVQLALGNTALQQRYAGTESLKNANEMLGVLQKMSGSKKIELVHQSSLGVFR